VAPVVSCTLEATVLPCQKGRELYKQKEAIGAQNPWEENSESMSLKYSNSHFTRDDS
jgi:hypothetical protein